jgi:hypothetical protein
VQLKTFFMKHKLFGSLAFIVMLFSIGCNNATDSSTTTVDSTKNADNTKMAPADTSHTAILPADNSLKDKKVSLDQLPSSVKPYVDKNFPGYVTKSAAHDPLCSGEDAIDVVIERSGHTTYSLIFKPDGTFVQKEEDVPSGGLPAKVKDVIKVKFPGAAVANQAERLTMADNSIQYVFDITVNNQTKEVIVAADGTIVCGN